MAAQKQRQAVLGTPLRLVFDSILVPLTIIDTWVTPQSSCERQQSKVMTIIALAMPGDQRDATFFRA